MTCLLAISVHSFCEPIPCQNGGTCTVVPHGYECTCSPGFMGTHCERKSALEFVILAFFRETGSGDLKTRTPNLKHCLSFIKSS